MKEEIKIIAVELATGVSIGLGVIFITYRDNWTLLGVILLVGGLDVRYKSRLRDE